MRIYKYTLELEQTQQIAIQGLKQVLSVCNQRNNIVLYALVDEKEKTTQCLEIKIAGTGHIIEKEAYMTHKFLGTVSIMQGHFMWHIFYRH